MTVAKMRQFEPGRCGKRVREMRERLGWSTRDLADRAGVAAGTVNAVERASHLSASKASTLQKLAKALGVELAWLMGLSNEKWNGKG